MSSKPGVIVTGASAGLGEVFAERFARARHPVLVVARRRDRLEELAERLRDDHGADVRVLAADLQEPSAREEVLEAFDATGWTLGTLVNNAGYGSTGPVHDTDVARTLGMIRLNVEALTHLCALVAPRMVAQRSGRILNVASTAAFQPGPNMSVYCATKAYVLSFSEGLAHELAPHGVTVTCHCPGATATEFGRVARNDETPLFTRGVVASAEDVVDDALAALDAGRVVRIHGLVNTVMAQANRFVPRSVSRHIAGRILARDPG